MAKVRLDTPRRRAPGPWWVVGDALRLREMVATCWRTRSMPRRQGEPWSGPVADGNTVRLTVTDAGRSRTHRRARQPLHPVPDTRRTRTAAARHAGRGTSVGSYARGTSWRHCRRTSGAVGRGDCGGPGPPAAAAPRPPRITPGRPAAAFRCCGVAVLRSSGLAASQVATRPCSAASLISSPVECTRSFLLMCARWVSMVFTLS